MWVVFCGSDQDAVAGGRRVPGVAGAQAVRKRRQRSILGTSWRLGLGARAARRWRVTSEVFGVRWLNATAWGSSQAELGGLVVDVGVDGGRNGRWERELGGHGWGRGPKGFSDSGASLLSFSAAPLRVRRSNHLRLLSARLGPKWPCLRCTGPSLDISAHAGTFLALTQMPNNHHLESGP